MKQLISHIGDGLASVVHALFTKPGDGPVQRVVFFTTSAGLYLFGLLKWAYFTNYGKISFQTADWYQEHAYYSILQSSLVNGTIPYHTNQLFHGSDRFMALPELVLSPQILLLSIVDSLGVFVLIHFLVLYSVGFAGCIAVQRRFQLSTFSFAVFLGLFTFNGYITSHLAVGHTMWGGYFFLPFLFLTLTNVADQRGSDLKNSLALAFVLFLILLQGSLHVFAASLLYVSLFFLANPRFFRVALLAIPSVLTLNFYRLFPAVITYRGVDDPFLSGYPTLLDILQALLSIERPSMEMVANLTGALYWWEMDVFIGLIAFAFLLYFGVYRSLNQDDPSLRFSAFNLPNAVMAIFSISHFYFFIAHLPIPFAGVERIPSRFLVIPVIVLLMISTVRLDSALKRLNSFHPVHLVALFCVVEVYLELMTHLRYWNVAAIDALLIPTSLIQIHTVQVVNDSFYIDSLKASYLVSAIGGVVCIALFVWNRFRGRPARETMDRTLL